MWARGIIVIFSLWLMGVCDAQANSMPTCDNAMQQAAAQTVSSYKPSGLSTFIRLENGQFWNNSELYTVRGVNYMPAQTPQYHFLIDTPDTVVRGDLGRFKAVGLNTIRIFLWHDGLFMCEGSGTVPLPGAVRFLDRFFAMTAEAGLRVIVTLNDQPDLDSDPLYENPTLAWQQFEYLVRRYANEPAILAWDVRSAGDVDYGANPDSPARFTRERVLAWLRRAVRSVKGLDTNHPVTASWQFAPLDTEPYVDFISVHRPASLDDARDLINEIKANTDKPLLLAGYGVSTYKISEADQSAAVLSYIDLSDREGLLGWLVWQAYDFPVNRICEPMPCRDQDGASLHEGLWRSDNTAKAVVLDLKLRLNHASAIGNPMRVVKVTATPTPVILTPMATLVPTAIP